MPKPTTELFKDILDWQFVAAYNTLMVLRANHPGYSDTELLLFALAAATQEPK